MESSNDFLKHLDELIQLFEKLQKKAIKNGIIIKDDIMFKDFKLLTDNYKMIKDTMPSELIGEIGEPIKEMLQKMIEQLKKELGEDDIISNNFTEQEVIQQDNKKSITVEIEEIDKKLQQNNLTEEEINRLLDKRAKLK